MTVEEKDFSPTQLEGLPGELETLPDEQEPLPVDPGSLAVAPLPVNNGLAETRTHSWPYFVAGMVVAVLAVALGVVLGYLARPALDGTTPGVVVTAKSPANLVEDVVQTGGHSKGPPEAPVVMVEYSDFQCPYCGRHAQEVAPRLEEAYIKNDQMRFVYKHFIVKGQDSVAAALAAECAAEQNKFWEYHDLLFGRAGQVVFNADNLKAFAAELGLDMATFSPCFDSQKYLNVVEANSTEAKQLGIRGTPGFFVNDTPVAGAESLEYFQQLIEEKLGALSQPTGS
ncbi:MAG: DsbA family protein [Anaerolineae bacterium]|nr:DsbA family protein [Anaerolineae bacterium]